MPKSTSHFRLGMLTIPEVADRANNPSALDEANANDSKKDLASDIGLSLDTGSDLNRNSTDQTSKKRKLQKDIDSDNMPNHLEARVAAMENFLQQYTLIANQSNEGKQAMINNLTMQVMDLNARVQFLEGIILSQSMNNNNLSTTSNEFQDSLQPVSSFTQPSSSSSAISTDKVDQKNNLEKSK